MSVETLTFGCRLNAAESLAMQARAAEAGLSDAILVNTCAVTAEAVRQARQAIRRARREHPQKRIVVTGCAAQIEPEAFAAMPEVDVVLGNVEKLCADSYRILAIPSGGTARIPKPDVVIAGLDPAIHSVLAGVINRSGMDARIKSGHDDDGSGEKIRVSDIFSVPATAAHTPAALSNLPRAFVEVQNGCDHRCTFCVIPFGRGNSRSLPMGAVVEGVRRVVAGGAREVVLAGVDITAYGTDLPGHPRLGTLVRKILKLVPELPRLRLSSIDSVEADDELMRALAEEERLMPHLHLSLQSGDDMILKRMKRRHSRADAIRFADEVRRLRPDIALGADVIAGFPTETDAMFLNTLSLIEECGLTFVHVFPYSPRPGTPAARMPQLRREVIQERARVLRQQRDAALASRLSAERGKQRSIFVEQRGWGRSEHYLPVAIDGGEAGDIRPVVIGDSDGKRLTAAEIREAA